MASRLLVAALAALPIAVLLGPLEARADEPVPTIEYHEDESPTPEARRRLLTYGVVLAAGSYGAALGASYMYPDDSGITDLRIPLVGPWIKLGHTEMCGDPTFEPDCSNAYQVIGAVLIGLDGLIQAGSLALLIQGVFMRTAAPSQASASLGYRTFRPTAQGAAPALDAAPSRLISPFSLQVGQITLVPSFSSVRGADASFGWIGSF